MYGPSFVPVATLRVQTAFPSDNQVFDSSLKSENARRKDVTTALTPAAPAACPGP